MNTANAILHLAWADFLERVRRYRFLLVLAATVWLGVLVVTGTAFFGLIPGDRNPLSPTYRGVLNPAWMGTMTVLVTNTFLGLFGFYLVSDCIARDTRTGVGEIIAATPVSRAAYLAGKWASSFAVLLVLEAILAAAAALMVLLSSDAALDAGALLMPFLAAGLPWLALVAAFAVAFETVPMLRGAPGNVLYFFLWLPLVIVTLLGTLEMPVIADPMGFGLFRPSLYEAAGAAYPGDTFSGMSVQINPGNSLQFKDFAWSGPAWTPGAVAGHWLWAALGLGLVLLSTTWFARFDPSRDGRRPPRGSATADKGGPAGERRRPLRVILPDLSQPVSRLAAASPFLGVLSAELRLLLKDRRWWWWVAAAGLGAAVFLFPLPIAREYLLPFLWLLPLPAWSALGHRERKHDTWQMVYACPRPVLRQLPAAWLAGVAATALFTIAAPIFSAVHADPAALAGWAVAVLFVPALALALGVVSSGSRVFEVAYTIWWFVGPVQEAPGFDFLAGAPQIYLPAIAGLLLVASLWRARQARRA